METEHISSQFDLIEEKVEKLIAFCKTLEETNLKLKDKVNQLEKELQAKTDTESTYSEERALIRSKIDNLLTRLDGIAMV
ncbi:MAG: cell division protein ZapB [Desulfobacterales bacterium]|nr:cell division protein ZapB [Desulfobacterales bacterium]